MQYGDHAKKLLALADGFDDHKQEREATKEFRKRWAKEGSLVCAICGFDKAPRLVEVAHRRALEEYGHTVLANLVPLCRSSVDGMPRNGQHLLSRLLDMHAGRTISIGRAAHKQGMRLGCHDLLDNGLIPKSGLERGARGGARGSPPGT